MNSERGRAGSTPNGDLHAGRLLLRFYAVAIVVTGVLSLVTGHLEPVLGAVIGGMIFVPFAYWLESM